MINKTEGPFMNLIYPVPFFDYETSKLESNMKFVMLLKSLQGPYTLKFLHI